MARPRKIKFGFDTEPTTPQIDNKIAEQEAPHAEIVKEIEQEFVEPVTEGADGDFNERKAYLLSSIRMINNLYGILDNEVFVDERNWLSQVAEEYITELEGYIA